MSSLITPRGILSFPALWVAKSPAPGAEPRFSCNIIFNKAAQATPEYKALRAAIAAVIDERFGMGKSRDATFLKKIKMPFRSCDERDYTGYDVEGGVFISPWTKNRPGVVDAQRQDILDASEVWSGQIVRASVHAFAFDTAGNRGAAFNLNNLQVTKSDMPRLDGRRAAKDEFGDDLDQDQDQGGDNDAPF